MAALAATVVGAVTWFAVMRQPSWDGPIRVGFRNSPPFYFSSGGGQPQGLAVDVLNVAAERAGLTLVWSELTGSSDAALQEGRIDIWPTTPVSGQVNANHVTEPWLQSAYFLVFLQGSGIHTPSDVAGRTVTLIRQKFENALAGKALPAILPLFVTSSNDKLRLVCDGTAAAALVEGREGQAAMLRRPEGCQDRALDFIRVEGATLPYGIGARPAAAAVADRLRNEIDTMAGDGRLALIHARWSFTTSDEVRLIYALQQTRLRNRLSFLGVVALALALLGASWQAVRSRQAQRLSEAYAREQERYRRLFERNLAGVYRVTDDGTILDCNEAFARMLGCESREDLLRRNAGDFYPDAASRAAMVDQLRRHLTLTNHEFVVRRVDGGTAILLESTSLVEGGDGTPAIFEGTVLDITRQRELEDQYRQAQKLESIGRLAGGVAHDFNNALTAINGFTELVLSSLTESDPNHAMLVQIRKAGQHAETLTRQLLAFSRRQHLQPTVINLNLIITETRSLLQRVIGEDVSLVTDLHADLGHVLADQGQIQQVMMNLAVNARDAMPRGGQLTIATSNVVLSDHVPAEPGVTPGAYCRVQVTDNGGGMEPETLRRVFEPFYTTKERGKGTGLGLSTVYGIVMQSGGRIRARSAIGDGTTFEIDLPRVDEALTEREPAAKHAGLRGSETVLVVEDQDDVRHLVRDALKTYGYTVLDAAGGDQGIARCRDHAGAIDLLLTDVVMPGVAGPAVAHACRQLRPTIRVLFMSGYTDSTLAGGAGGEAVAYLQKPFTPIQLAATVREILDGPNPGESEKAPRAATGVVSRPSDQGF